MITKIFYSQNTNKKTIDDVVSGCKIVEEYLNSVFNTKVMVLDQYSDPLTWRMVKTMSLMSEADLIVFDRNWKESRECQIVMMTCEEFNMPFMVIPLMF